MQDLGTLGGHNSQAHGINSSGHITGRASRPSADHAFLYSNGVMRDLGTLGGNTSDGWAINDNDRVTGSSYLADGFSYHAFLYDGSSMQDLGTLGGNFSAGVAISSLAQVVGDSYTSSGALHAFLFDGSSIIDLNDLIPADSGWVLMYASGINDSGQIIGIGTFFGEDRGFLLTAQ